jgi:hypothetical protein
VARARYLSMNNVRAQSGQRSPSFGCYASRARQRWRRRNAHLKSHQGLSKAARAVKSSETHIARAAALRLESALAGKKELFGSSEFVRIFVHAELLRRHSDDLLE